MNGGRGRARHSNLTHCGYTETALGRIRHLPVQVEGVGIIHAPVLVEYREHNRLPYPMRQQDTGRFLYALPGGHVVVS